MDFHAEQLIIKRKTAMEYLLAIVISFVTVILWVFFFMINAYIFNAAFLLIFGVGWGAWKLIQMLNIEYEYTLINHYLDIDKIIGKARRKSIVSIDFRQIEQCASVDDTSFKNTAGIVKTYDLSGNPDAAGRVFVDFILGEKGKVRVIFRPNDTIKDILKKANPKMVRL